MYYKHVFTLRHDGLTEIKLGMFKSFKWPGYLENQQKPTEVKEVEMEEILLGNRTETEEDPVEKEEIMDTHQENGLSGTLRTMQLRTRIDPPVGNTLLCVNHKHELSLEDVEAYAKDQIRRNEDDFVESAKISV